jgi:hypothetical protein
MLSSNANTKTVCCRKAKRIITSLFPVDSEGDGKKDEVASKKEDDTIRCCCIDNPKGCQLAYFNKQLKKMIGGGCGTLGGGWNSFYNKDPKVECEVELSNALEFFDEAEVNGAGPAFAVEGGKDEL